MNALQPARRDVTDRARRARLGVDWADHFDGSPSPRSTVSGEVSALRDCWDIDGVRGEHAAALRLRRCSATDISRMIESVKHQPN
jgi:hypothetical protein